MAAGRGRRADPGDHRRQVSWARRFQRDDSPPNHDSTATTPASPHSAALLWLRLHLLTPLRSHRPFTRRGHLLYCVARPPLIADPSPAPVPAPSRVRYCLLPTTSSLPPPTALRSASWAATSSTRLATRTPSCLRSSCSSTWPPSSSAFPSLCTEATRRRAFASRRCF